MTDGSRTKFVLITGCTQGGIGNSLAREFHARGFHVIATARDASRLADLVALGMSAVPLELTDDDSILACRKAVDDICGGRLDILINNAGRTHILPATDLTRPDVRSVFETNVFGAMAMCAAFMPLLMASRGLIVNMSSLAAATAYPFSAAYCASKGALVAYSRTLRAEARPLGVRVMIAMAGQVRSALSTRLGNDLTLPETSLYKPVEQAYRDRLAFSVAPAAMARKMPADEFARRLVDKTLAPEVPAWLRTWCGRPDWFWEGRRARKVWWGLALGEWLVEEVVYRMFGMGRIEGVLRGLEEGRKGW